MSQAFATHRVQQVREMRAAGASLEDICNSLGFSRPVLARLIREHEIPRPQSGHPCQVRPPRLPAA
jgi:hypothetical protein